MSDVPLETSQEPTRQAVLPVELIGRIALIYDVLPERDHKTEPLRDLALISPTFRAETERLLYSDLTLGKLSRVVKCFKTILARPHLARHVRTLAINLHLDSSNSPDFWQMLGLPLDPRVIEDEQRRKGAVLMGFGKLVRKVLMMLVNLKEYSLSFCGRSGRDELVYSPPWLPDEAPFELHRFAVDLNASGHVAAFLASQPSITDLVAPHFTSSRFPLPKPSPKSKTALSLKKIYLPNLAGLVAHPTVASHLAPGRPLCRVYLKDRRLQPAMSSLNSSLPHLAKSTTPIRHVDTHIVDVTSAISNVMDPMAQHLPDIQSLTMRRLSIRDRKPYDVYLSDAFCDKLSQFKKIKTLNLPAPTSLSHLGVAGMAGMAGMDPGIPIAFEATINAQIVLDQPGPPGAPPAFPLGIGLGAPPPPQPQPPLQGPALPPNFHQNQNNNEGGPPPPPGEFGAENVMGMAVQQIFNALLNGPGPGAGAAQAQQPPTAAGQGGAAIGIGIGPAFGGMGGGAGVTIHMGFGPIGPLAQQHQHHPNPQNNTPNPVPMDALPFPLPPLAGGAGAPPILLPFPPISTVGAPNGGPTDAPAIEPTGPPGVFGEWLHTEMTDEEVDNDDDNHFGPPPQNLPAQQGPQGGNLLGALFQNFVNGGANPPPADPAGPGLPLWNATIVGYHDLSTGNFTDDSNHRHYQPKTKEEVELEKTLVDAMRKLESQERLILEKWRRAIPGLNKVTFEMDIKRRTKWVFKKAPAPSRPESPSSIVGNVGSDDAIYSSDLMDIDGSPVEGIWEVEYVYPEPE